MSKRNAKLLLDDILLAVEKIERYTVDMDRKGFLEDEKTIDAVVRNLEIIGEATKQLPEEFTLKYSTLPWQQIAGLRNRIVHDYFGLDIDIIWEIIQHDLTAFGSQIEQLLIENQV